MNASTRKASTRKKPSKAVTARRKREAVVAARSAAAKALGRLGGLARKKNLTPERRSEIARLANRARHQKSAGESTVETPDA